MRRRGNPEQINLRDAMGHAFSRMWPHVQRQQLADKMPVARESRPTSVSPALRYNLSQLVNLLWGKALPLHRECRGTLLTRKPSVLPRPAHAWAALIGAHRYIKGRPVQYPSLLQTARGQSSLEGRTGLCTRVETTSPSQWISDWGYCAESWQPKAGDCLVVSIGIGGTFFFEEVMAARGCEVHAFDPTTELRAKHQKVVNRWNTEQADCPGCRASRIRFHFAGLGRAGTRSSAPNDYGSLGGPIYPLRELLRIANITDHRTIDVLRLDCEGCEWASFHQLQQHDATLLSRVRQLLVELHFGAKTMRPPVDAELRAFLQHVVADHGFATFKWTPNAGNVKKPINFTSALVRSLALSPQLCCYELHMQRLLPALPPARHSQPSVDGHWKRDALEAEGLFGARPGFCAPTDMVASRDSAARLCASPTSAVSFALPWKPEMATISGCAAACIETCGRKCRFVSHSALLRDCSVYNECDMNLLHPSPHGEPDLLMGIDFTSVSVVPTHEEAAPAGAVEDLLHGLCKHDFAVHNGYTFA